MPDSESRKRVLKRRASIGSWLMGPGAVLILFPLPLSFLGFALFVTGLAVMMPAVKELRSIGTPVTQSERKRRYWLFFGLGAVSIFGFGFLFSRSMTPTQLLIYWLFLIVVFSGLMISGWFISKRWTK